MDGPVVRIDSTSVRLRRRNDHASSPSATLKHEVARVAQRWSEAHPDDYDDSDEDQEPFGFADNVSNGSIGSGPEDWHGSHEPSDDGEKTPEPQEETITMDSGRGRSVSPETVHGSGQQPVDSRKAFKMAKVVEELVTTERGFCEDLDKLVDLDQQLRRAHLSVQESSLLFGNLQALTNLHASLFSDLVAVVPEPATWDPSPDELESCVKQICRTLTSTDFLTVYAPYCANHPAQLSTLAARNGDAGFRQALKSWQDNEGSKLPLNSFLLKPVQRILKYPLLVDQLLRAAPPDSGLAAALGQTHRMLATVAQNANRIKRQQELETLMAGDVLIVRGRTLADKLRAGGFDGDLSLFGALLDEAAGLTMVASRRRNARNKPKSRTLYLFRRALLSCKPVDANRITVKRIFAMGNFHVKGLRRSLEVVEHGTSISYTFSGLDGVEWAQQIGELPTTQQGAAATPLAPDNAPTIPRRGEDGTGAIPLTVGGGSENGGGGPPLSPNMPTTPRSNSMTGAVERLTQERVGLLKRNEKLLKERWIMMQQQTASEEEKQSLITAHGLALAKKDEDIAMLAADREASLRDMEEQLDNERQRADKAEAARAKAEAELASSERAQSEAEFATAALEAQLGERAKGLSELRELHKERVATLEQTIAELKTAGNLTRAELADTTGRALELEEEVEKLTTDLELAHVSVERADADARRQQAEIAVRLEALLRLDADEDVQDDDHGMVEGAGRGTGHANKKSVRSLSETVSAVESAHAGLQAKVAQVEARAASANETLDQLRRRVCSLEAASNAAARALFDAESAVSTANEEMALARRERDEQRAAADLAQAARLKAEQAAATATSELAHSQAAVKKLREDLSEALARVHTLEEANRSASSTTTSHATSVSPQRLPVEEDAEVERLKIELAKTKAMLHQFMGGSTPSPTPDGRRSNGSSSNEGRGSSVSAVGVSVADVDADMYTAAGSNLLWDASGLPPLGGLGATPRTVSAGPQGAWSQGSPTTRSGQALSVPAGDADQGRRTSNFDEVTGWITTLVGYSQS
eukprot:m.170477 g.170477  ORF g.170477 m.170477 type:complete len:1048 (-) comp13249_c0_seq1:171-3314(-)